MMKYLAAAGEIWLEVRYRVSPIIDKMIRWPDYRLNL
jgi:hypothetical protein